MKTYNLTIEESNLICEELSTIASEYRSRLRTLERRIANRRKDGDKNITFRDLDKEIAEKTFYKDQIALYGTLANKFNPFTVPVAE